MLTVDHGIIIVVSCCTELSFSALDNVSLNVLWSLLIDACYQTMCILQTFDEYPDGGCIIHKVASLSFHLELVDICCKGFLFSLPDFHEAQCVSMNISIAQLYTNRSFVSSQDLSKLMASVTNVHVNPLQFTLASLALLSLERSATVN